jgi:hypothetical protein
MKNTLRKRVALLSILLLAGVLVGVVVTASGPEKVVPGTGKEYIEVVKARPTAWTPEEREYHRAQHAARTNALLGIALNDERVQKTIAGREYTVVGVALKHPVRGVTGNNATGGAADTAYLALRVGGDYYKVTIDVRGERVTSIDARSPYTRP